MSGPTQGKDTKFPYLIQCDSKKDHPDKENRNLSYFQKQTPSDKKKEYK